MKKEYTIEQIADFLREHAWNIVGTWSDDVLYSHIRWFDAIGGLGRAYRGNELVGVAWARIVDDPENIKDTPTQKEHNEKGSTVFVDLVAVKSKKAFKTLIFIMVQRFGRRLVIAFNRKKYDDRLRIHNWYEFTMKAS
jgi:hypothetical protein